MKALVPIDVIEKKILFINGQKVLLDSDLAALYGVTTKRLNEQVRRNLKRFPVDFMYQLSQEEFESLRSHFATLNKSRGKHRKYLPYVFTEQGIAMLSSVLNSERAVEVRPRKLGLPDFVGAGRPQTCAFALRAALDNKAPSPFFPLPSRERGRGEGQY